MGDNVQLHLRTQLEPAERDGKRYSIKFEEWNFPQELSNGDSAVALSIQAREGWNPHEGKDMGPASSGGQSPKRVTRVWLLLSQGPPPHSSGETGKQP